MAAKTEHANVDRTVKELLPSSKAGWAVFTKAAAGAVIGVAAILLLMLLFLYVL